MGAFPDIRFGECLYEGHLGPDYNASTLTGADATDEDYLDYTGNGYQLILFEGDWMCDMCKKRILADRESEFDQDKQATEQEFRDSAGFVTTI